MDMKAQAVIIDGIFFLMLCASAAALLFWAASVYGATSFKAYYFMYMGEFDSGILNTLTEIEYEQPAGAKRFFLDEIGYYMIGAFDNADPRYEAMMMQWHTLCLQSPHPLELSVYAPDTPVVFGTYADPLLFSCPISSSDPYGENISKWVEDFQKGACNRDGDGNIMACDSLPTPKYTCPDQAGVPTKCKPKPPYYSSGEQRKICGKIACMMEAKIYY
ncbi:hypothetical protein K8R43_04005 [archaeon]|nr:hypothetical protein [archaeon]